LKPKGRRIAIMPKKIFTIVKQSLNTYKFTKLLYDGCWPFMTLHIDYRDNNGQW